MFVCMYVCLDFTSSCIEWKYVWKEFQCGGIKDVCTVSLISLNLPVFGLYVCMYICMYLCMYVCMYVGLTNIMFMPPGSLLVEIVGVFDGRMLPLCGNSSNTYNLLSSYCYTSSL